MKNNELLLTVIFQKDNYEMTLLMNKDITLKAMLEALYYGLMNDDDDRNHFELFKKYTKNYTHLAVQYRAKNEMKLISVKECIEKKLFELGIVTTSSIIIPCTEEIQLKPLFVDYNLPALCDQDKLEYNISTRRIAVAEASVIDIIPAGEMPGKQRRRYVDIIVPTLISMSTLFAGRALLAMFNDSAAGFSMLAMMMTTSVSTMATQTYNFFKQGRDSEKSIEEWKENYEKYLTRIWNRIQDWQKSDINYLRTTYPDLEELFRNVSMLDRAVFARSQNDSDFLKISLGRSENVEPMFEIKNDKKDQVFYDIGYVIHKDNEKRRIEMILPKKKKKKNSTAREEKNDGLLVDLAYNLSSKTFRYLNAEREGELPPLILNLKNCGAMGIIEENYRYSENFIEHIVFELAYYHTPEDLQFVFFFNKEDDESVRRRKICNYKNLPHANELFEDAAQFVFDKDSAAIAFGKLQSIMSERTKETNGEEENKASVEQYTQIVCVIFDDYDIKETGFSKYLPKPPVEGEAYINYNGLTFIFVSRNLAQLPRYCGNIIEVTAGTDADAKVSDRYNVLSRETLNSLSKSGGIREGKTNNIENLIDFKKFNNHYIFYDSGQIEGNRIKNAYEESFRRLSAVYYRRIAENGNVPSVVTLFEIYNNYETIGEESKRLIYPLLLNWHKICSNQQNKDMLKQLRFLLNQEDKSEFNYNQFYDNKFLCMMIENWSTSDVTHDLSVPIGKNEHGIVNLDLYEKADGPHMLVAGTTGSGKSETIITYLIGLCMKYSPTYLNLMLVDMKGGGFSNRLRTLPHCVGVVDDTAGESDGISSVYMLKRFLEVLNFEIKHRKILLNEFGVDNVDAYIRAERVISQILKGGSDPKLRKILNEKQTIVLEKLIKINNERSENDPMQFPETLSHLVLVVDEFTELKRFSSESDDIDFITEITTIARVGRTLGFHIILVSQNIEGAITEDIRINSKSRICLKVATRTASKEMLDGRPDAASPTMPGNGRAYLLVGTGSKFLYFQSAFTGAHKDEKIEHVVSVTKMNTCGNHNRHYYQSDIHNARIKKASANIKEHDTQLSYIVRMVEAIDKGNIGESVFKKPRIIFKEPLKSSYPDLTEWR